MADDEKVRLIITITLNIYKLHELGSNLTGSLIGLQFTAVLFS